MYVLAIFWMTIKRMMNNWRLELALLFGLVLAVGVVSAIPIYTAGSLQDSLVRQWFRQSSSRPPMGLMMTHSNPSYTHDVTLDRIHDLTDYLHRELPGRLRSEPTTVSIAAELGINYFVSTDPSRPRPRSPYANIKAIRELQELAVITDGRWFEPRSDGVIEIVVDDNSLEELQMLVGEQYSYEYAPRGEEKTILTLQLVGVFSPLPELRSTDRWIYPPPFSRSVFVDFELFHDVFLADMSLRPTAYDWYFVFDPSVVRVDRLDTLIKDLGTIEARAGQMIDDTRFWLSPLSLFRWFYQRAQVISGFLAALSVPIVGMVLYYVVLIAGLTVERRRNEIAVFHSRGAGRVQVVVSFLLEWFILGAVALAVGPYVGLFVSRVMGASAGFLTFVGRKALPVTLAQDAYKYGFYAILLAVCAAMIPAIRSSKHSIVSFKQQLARGGSNYFIFRFFIDFILLGVSYYGYRTLAFQGREAPEGLAGMADPLLFFVPVVFLLGAGLLFLRIYPMVMALLAWATRRLRGIVLHLTLRQLGRNSGQYLPLMVLLILTVSLAIYTASAARTLDRNFVDEVYFTVGADLSLKEQWAVPGGSGPPDAFNGGGSMVPDAEERVYEPPFYIHQSLPGVESAARVLRFSANARAGGRFMGEADVMAIVPWEFGQTAWYRDDLAPFHLYEYLNVLTRHREGMLTSPEVLEQANLAPGDTVTLTFKNQPIDVYVAGAVPHWPTLGFKNKPFAVINLDYVQEVISLEPYDVWLSLSSPGYLADIVEGLREEGIYVTTLQDANSLIVEGRNEPHRMGFYGVLSIGFIVSALVTVVGFMLYTFLSMRNRLLQFGVMRAVGLSVTQLIALLGLEQLLSLGIGLGAGTALGVAATQLFLPFLREGTDAGAVIPFVIVTDPADLRTIFTVLGVMLIVAVTGLAMMLVRMKLNQAIKLGEEA